MQTTEKQKPERVLRNFLSRIDSDPRIRTAHIAAFLTLYGLWLKSHCPERMDIKSSKIMHLAKISSSATWHRVIRSLHEFGYIDYHPNFNKMASSYVSLSTSVH